MSDDLASHLFILLELAAWHTATGDLDNAAAFLEKVAAEHTDCPEIRCLTNLARGNLALARGDVPAALDIIHTAHSSTGGTPGELPGEEAEHTFVPPYLAGVWAALEGNTRLETGKFHQASTVAGNCAVEEPLHNVPVDLVLFHARLLSRKGDAREALDLLGRVAEPHGAERPLHWLSLTLDRVRLARRSGDPQPELAARARDLALRLDLPGLAHEFVPFT